MAYRDEKESMKMRIATLEGELSVAQESIARLKGQVDEHGSSEMADMLTKETLNVSRELDVVLSDAGVEAIAQMLRQRLPKSQLSEVGRTLTCQWGTAELRVVRHAERTELRLSAKDPRHWATNALGGFGFAVLGGPLIVGPLVALAGPWMAVAAVPLVLIGGYLLMDKLTKSTLRNTRTTLRGALESAIELAREHQVQAPVRIDIAAMADSEAEAEAQAEAEIDAMAVAEVEQEIEATPE